MEIVYLFNIELGGDELHIQIDRAHIHSLQVEQIIQGTKQYNSKIKNSIRIVLVF